jgi:hypothetical protein
MGKQWQSNALFHTYYIQPKRDIEAEPHMTLNTLKWFRPLMNFCADQHFIYITTRANENKEELLSYYKLTEEDLEEITKEWSANFLIPIDPTEMSDPKIDSMEAAHIEHDTPETNIRKKTEEVQDLSSTSKKTASTSPRRRGDDEVEEINGKEDEHKQGEVTLPRDEANPLKKRKVSPPKPSSQKKSRATVTKMKIVLTVDNFDFIITTVNDASQEILQKK